MAGKFPGMPLARALALAAALFVGVGEQAVAPCKAGRPSGKGTATARLKALRKGGAGAIAVGTVS